MSAREFTDRKGTKWRVNEIIPQFAERRRADRRAASGALPPSGMRVERRTAERRRIAAPRARVTDGYERGWLTFESPDEKRRLAPIPNGWESYSSERLELLCRLAQPAEQRLGHAID